MASYVCNSISIRYDSCGFVDTMHSILFLRDVLGSSVGNTILPCYGEATYINVSILTSLEKIVTMPKVLNPNKSINAGTILKYQEDNFQYCSIAIRNIRMPITQFSSRAKGKKVDEP